ncbi:MAG: histidinol-phosphatase [Clostridia bacterium]|nr:histidinol-phosphatase [Clostridia bacterium]
MIYNYHTHTKRCNHATGADREYVEAAIKAGIKTLGFSDHAPYDFPAEIPEYSYFRMKKEEGFEYVESVRSLAKEYASDIRILCGFEMEYYPDYHQSQMDYLKRFSPDYLILGQHMLGNEFPTILPREAGDLHLSYYVTQVLAGLATGDFLYLAHPDLAGYGFSPETVAREYRRLALGAKRMGIPVELNALGLREGRAYPDVRFFRFAAEAGCKVIYGVDAHSPDAFLRADIEERAKKIALEVGVSLITDPIL